MTAVVISCSGSSSILPIVAVVSCNPVNKEGYLTSVLLYKIGDFNGSMLSSSGRALGGSSGVGNC